MARTEFTDEERKNPLFVEIKTHPHDGVNRGLVEFHGFYTEEALFRSRAARDHLLRHRIDRMSDYLRFIAELFVDLERQNAPMPNNLRDTTCPHTGLPCTRGCFDIRPSVNPVCRASS